MYCPNCGKQLPDGARFCNACGRPLAAAAPEPEPAYTAPPSQQADYAQPAPAPAQPPVKKSKTGLIIAAAVVIAALVLGRFVIAPSMGGAGGESAGLGDLIEPSHADAPAEAAETETGGPADRETNDGYYQVLAGIGYRPITSPEELAEGMNDPTVEFFVRDNGDGSIECHDYAAEGDTVVKYYETLLLDLTGVPAEQREQVEGSLTERLPELNELDFVTAVYMSNGIDANGVGVGILTVYCTDLDREENWRVLCDMGIFSGDGPYSLSAIKQAELAGGFISLYK